MEPRFSARAATVRASSYREEDNSLEIVWTTGADVVRYPWFGEPYVEELDTSPEAVRLERMQSGRAPFLDSHNGWSLRSVIGNVLPGTAVLEDGEGRARVRLSEAPEHAGIVANIRAGIISNVSVGYEVHREERTKASDGQLERRKAVDWEPYEVSAVPMGADPGAHVRAMYQRRGIDPPRPERSDMVDRTKTAPTEQSVDLDKVREEAAAQARAEGAKAERERIAQIRAAGKRCGVGAELVEQLIRDDVPINEARAQILATDAAEQDAVRTDPHFAPGQRDEKRQRHEAMVQAILHRWKPAKFKVEPGNGAEYRYMPGRDVAREVLSWHGVEARGLAPGKVIELAFETRLGALAGTGDFGNVLADAANKAMQMGYEESPRTFTPWCDRATAPDFRTIHNIKLSEIPDFQQVNEHGEFERDTLSDGDETYVLKTYGLILGITRQVLINDKMGAILKRMRNFGAAAARKESDIVWGLVTANGTMGDGIALFHASHGNLRTSGAAPDPTELAGMELLLGLQTDLGGSKLNLNGAFILAPKTLMHALEQLFSTRYVPTAASGVVTGPPYQRIYEPRLDAASTARYYMTASPNEAPTIDYAYLEGNEGVYSESRQGFDVDGVEVKGRLDFGAGVQDHRGMVRNDGGV